MKTKKVVIILTLIFAMLLSAGIGAYAATNYGTSGDPLVTVSYLNSVLVPDILSKLQTKLDAAVAGIEADGSLTGTESYAVVTLSKGQTVTGGVGCELLLRIGTATAAGPSSPGLVDTTTGGTLNSGASLTTNHLYMVTIANNGMTATSNTVKVLVRGTYTVG